MALALRSLVPGDMPVHIFDQADGAFEQSLQLKEKLSGPESYELVEILTRIVEHCLDTDPAAAPPWLTEPGTFSSSKGFFAILEPPGQIRTFRRR